MPAKFPFKYAKKETLIYQICKKSGILSTLEPITHKKLTMTLRHPNSESKELEEVNLKKMGVSLEFI